MIINILFTIAELLLVSAYLFNNILVLRALAASGLAMYVVAGFVADYRSPGMLALIVFSGIASFINIYKLFMILKDTLSIFLPDHMRKIHSKYFPSMSNTEFIQIYKIATETSFSRGELVLDKGVQNSLLIFIEKGTAIIDHNEDILISSGNFIGEMSFISKNVTTAAVHVFSEDLVCLIWEKERLAKLEKSMPQLYQKLFQSIAVDLVHKLSKSKL